MPDEFKGSVTNTPSEPRAAPMPVNGRRATADLSWPEDYADGENQYDCLCIYCERVFWGHKRRIACRRCDEMILRPMAQVRAQHDARVTELLEANNNAVMNRRMLQVQVDTMARIGGARERTLAHAIKERDDAMRVLLDQAARHSEALNRTRAEDHEACASLCDNWVNIIVPNRDEASAGMAEAAEKLAQQIRHRAHLVAEGKL